MNYVSKSNPCLSYALQCDCFGQGHMNLIYFIMYETEITFLQFPSRESANLPYHCCPEEPRLAEKNSLINCLMKQIQ